MSNAKRVLELFAEANPVPNEDRQDHVEVPAASYLKALERRPPEVARLDSTVEHRVDAMPRWIAAAILALVVGLAAVILSQIRSEPPVGTDPSPTTTTVAESASDITGFWESDGLTFLALLEDGTYFSSQPGFLTDEGRWQAVDGQLELVSSAESPTCHDQAVGTFGYDVADEGSLTLVRSADDCIGRGIATTSQAMTFTQTSPFGRPEVSLQPWEAIPDDRSAIGRAGTYRTFLFRPEFSVTLPSGWGRTSPSHPQVVAFGPDAISNGCCQNTFLDTKLELIFVSKPGQSIEDLLSGTLKTAQLDISDTSATEISGAIGHRLDGEVLTTYAIYNEDGNTVSMPRGAAFTMWLLEVNENTVVLVSMGATIDELQARMPTIEPIIESIVWKELADG